MMVDTKNGDSYDGVLVACDTFMNMQMKDVIITSKDGKFNKCKEVFVRGNNINSI
jgi:U6 snRNA-associated Sm-like protein LSm4